MACPARCNCLGKRLERNRVFVAILSRLPVKDLLGRGKGREVEAIPRQGAVRGCAEAGGVARQGAEAAPGQAAVLLGRDPGQQDAIPGRGLQTPARQGRGAVVRGPVSEQELVDMVRREARGHGASGVGARVRVK